MERVFLDGDLSTAGRSDTRWTYWRPTADGVVELGTLHGREVGLSTHFHDESQITFVLSGRRRFFVEGELIDLAAGEGTLIPAGVPHKSFAEPGGVVCLNAYVPAARYEVAAMMKEIQRLWRRADQVRWDDLITVIREHQKAEEPANPGTPAGPARHSVGEVAARTGMSREGFSRKFTRRSGMPPHAFWLAGRLNRARKLLRAGEPIAVVAAETGFADQSHLGRWFRRAFGVTPGQYRLG